MDNVNQLSLHNLTQTTFAVQLHLQHLDTQTRNLGRNRGIIVDPVVYDMVMRLGRGTRLEPCLP
jgi:hypothetical protein